MIESKILLDSVSPSGVRLTTFRYRLPKCLLAQLNTHRAFERLARSSRAISFDAMIEEEPYFPAYWGKESRGMKAASELPDESKDKAIELTKELREVTLNYLKQLQELGLHREYLNRYYEPFAYVEGIITATEFTNFFKLRAKGQGATEEIAILAEMMKSQRKESEPVIRTFHAPLSDEGQDPDVRIVQSVARCARVSYGNHLNKTDFEKDLGLFIRLWENKHLSPFGMVAFAPQDEKLEGFTHFGLGTREYFSGPFKEWKQLRHLPNKIRQVINKLV